jgi:hypothetical protein
MAASAKVAVSTVVLAMPFALPTLAAAHGSATRGVSAHGTAAHARAFNDHAQTPHFDQGDLTVFTALAEPSVERLIVGSVAHAHERLTPTASARGPP